MPFLGSMNVLRARPSVKFDHIAPAGFRILAALDEATQYLGEDLMITSGTDSHVAPDPHALGVAYDISVEGLSVEITMRLVQYLRVTLGTLFTTLYECPTAPSDARLASIMYLNPDATGPHLHIQRKKGTVFPTPPSVAA